MSQQTEEHTGPERSSQRPKTPYLLVSHPLAAVVPWRLGEVGRADLESLGVRDAKVSSKHFVLSGHGGVPHVADAGSRNGTFVDGRQLASGERVPLIDGTVLRAGTTLFVHRIAVQGLVPTPPIGALAGPFGLSEVRRAIDHAVGRRAENILILGESGTGKELVAQHVGARLQRKVIAVNVAAIPSTLAESTLFGHEAGAYSDARKQGARGLVGDAEGGVLFLDELGELPLELQPKLLRLLENRMAQSVGGRERKVDLVVIAATNRDLEAAIQAQTFRRDVVERFAHRVVLPSLHERPEDIPTLVRHTIAFGGLPLEANASEVEAIEHLMLRVFPGNLRTLRRALEEAVAATGGGRLTREGVVQARLAERTGGALTSARVSEALASCGGNESVAAEVLGVSRGMLLRAKKRGLRSWCEKEFHCQRRAGSLGRDRFEALAQHTLRGGKMEGPKRAGRNCAARDISQLERRASLVQLGRGHRIASLAYPTVGGQADGAKTDLGYLSSACGQHPTAPFYHPRVE